MTRIFLFSALLFSQTIWAQIPNFIQVNQNLSRGGRPTAGDVRGLHEMGYKTIINLENSSKYYEAEKLVAEKLGLKFFSVPMSAFKTPTDQEANFILEQMTNPENFPVFIHCHHGEDRTGLMMGLYRVLVDHWDPKAAYQEMKDDGFHSILFPLKHYFNERTSSSIGEDDEEN